tara:strand:- start:601 stop:1524 length:924 start_codon:yes stop_codon:yes gene_type:complete
LRKLYLNKANEDWILDRLRKEWYSNQRAISSKSIFLSDIIWICSPWTWKKIPKRKLKRKKVICSIYHIDEVKFTDKDLKEFQERDQYVDFYHVISENSKKQLEKYTDKLIISIPFWADSSKWFNIEDKKSLRHKYKIPEDFFIIGSFQRDTEGSDLTSPKLSKGPDRFIKIVKKISEDKKIHIALSGRRRNFVINELNKLDIPFSYFEMVNQETLNELYNCLDLYIVASRVEGGPQSIIECALSKTPIISTNVGVAPEILSSESIFNMDNYLNAKPNVNFAYNSALNLSIPKGFEKFVEMFGLDYEN